MTIDEAIERLTKRSQDFRPGFDPNEKEAIKLGIEALKLFKFMREHPGHSVEAVLPGETEK